jgi:hypothetical protein
MATSPTPTPRGAATPDSLTGVLRRSGVCAGTDLQETLGVSQSTLSRLIGRTPDVVAIGRGPSTQYALRRHVGDLKGDVSVFRVSERGQIAPFGTLTPLYPSAYVFRSATGGRDRVFDALPWFVQDIRPQGFLGRQKPRRYPELQLPERILDWTDDEVLTYLARRGEDTVGDLLIGHESCNRFLGMQASPATAMQVISRDGYARVALDALGGSAPASSAGGEQPKFLCTAPDGRQLIVKFSPPAGQSAAAQRWADLLITEHLALETLREHGMAAAQTDIVHEDGRVMLEVVREDRTAQGRRAFVSGTCVDGELAGVGHGWYRLAQTLVAEKVLSTADAETVGILELYGGLIGNTDMHLGNVSFLTRDYERLELAPAYDVLPMIFAPTDRGEVIDRAFNPPLPTVDRMDQWRRSAAMALSFWNAVAGDERLSDDFKAKARPVAARVTDLAVSFGERNYGDEGANVHGGGKQAATIKSAIDDGPG